MGRGRTIEQTNSEERLKKKQRNVWREWENVTTIKKSSATRKSYLLKDSTNKSNSNWPHVFKLNSAYLNNWQVLLKFPRSIYKWCFYKTNSFSLPDKQEISAPAVEGLTSHLSFVYRKQVSSPMKDQNEQHHFQQPLAKDSNTYSRKSVGLIQLKGHNLEHEQIYISMHFN